MALSVPQNPIGYISLGLENLRDLRDSTDFFMISINFTFDFDASGITFHSIPAKNVPVITHGL